VSAKEVVYDVAGLVFVVAGGTTGMGLSAASLLLRQGARVVVFSRSEANVAAALEHLGPDACGFSGDASQPETAEMAVKLAVERWGRVDGLYHVAGGSGRSRGDGPVHELTPEGWDYTLRLNLDSVVYSNRAVVKQLLAQGEGGVVLNMSSVLGWSPAPKFFASHAYAAAKAGIIGLSKAMAASYAMADIRVNVIAPALVQTPMSARAQNNEAIMSYVARKQPLDGGRIGSADDVDGAAVFLLSRAARYITGQVVAVDGGWTVTEGSME
jgi:NAD(P)-dependent dehydrogenase (short-subunit alcohol dehydrogenase family)